MAIKLKFNNLSLRDWRQFASVDIAFHPKLTILTGANGAGKSTLLRILSQHFGWENQLLSTPTISETGVRHYFTGLFSKLIGNQEINVPSIGEITYSNGGISKLVVPESGGIAYNLEIPQAQAVDGLFVPSHRTSQQYQPIGSIPTNGIAAKQAYQTYHSESMNRFQGGHSQYGPVYRMKEAIISMAMFGPGNQYVARNQDLEQTFLAFKEVLALVLPPAVGFRDISVRVPDVVVVTDTGDFVIDSASGGLMSLIDLAWQIFLFSRNRAEFVVTLDEPENHLHPSMQRALLANLVSAFPQAQFVVASHSPFIVSSVRDSSVYVLRHVDEEGSNRKVIQRRISSTSLDHANKAATASEILRDVLGVPVTLPIWAEADLKSVVEKFTRSPIDAKLLAELRQHLREVGLDEFYSEALVSLTRENP